MLVNLEVLMKSNYVNLLKSWEKRNNKNVICNFDNPDYNMARFKVDYIDEVIGKMAYYCQTWIDKNFALDYCIKGLYKTADEDERKYLFNFRKEYRNISLKLLKSFAWIFYEENTKIDTENISELLHSLEKIKKQSMSTEDTILSIMELLNNKIADLLEEIEEMIDENIILDKNNKLTDAIQDWRKKTEWKLINPY